MGLAKPSFLEEVWMGTRWGPFWIWAIERRVKRVRIGKVKGVKTGKVG